MGRMSLFKPNRGNNFNFIDKNISQYFTVSGTDINVHKYLGPKSKNVGTVDEPIYETDSVTNIQDLLFLENRDRKYEPDIYKIRGIYNVQNLDFNLSQFGIFLDNDTISLMVHINDIINIIGRKPIAGDVLDFPHLRDEFALNDFDVSLPKYYVVEDVTRASEGYSATWYPHLYRLKLKKLTDSQQFADILDKPATESDDFTLRDLLSTRSTEMMINDAVVGQAEVDAPKSGYETQQFFKIDRDENGHTILCTVDMDEYDASHSSAVGDYFGVNQGANISAATWNAVPKRGFNGYLVGDGFPVNGHLFGMGIQFPDNPATDDFYLRTDFIPNRLYRFATKRWVKVEDSVRMTLTNTDDRQTHRTSFTNNDKYVYSAVAHVLYANAERLSTVINTEHEYVTAKYLVLTLRPPKMKYVVMDFAVEDYPNLFENVNDQLVINLPVVDDEQVTLPLAGTWKIELCNSREAQRQSLSTVLKLKPQADL